MLPEQLLHKVLQISNAHRHRHTCACSLHIPSSLSLISIDDLHVLSTLCFPFPWLAVTFYQEKNSWLKCHVYECNEAVDQSATYRHTGVRSLACTRMCSRRCVHTQNMRFITKAFITPCDLNWSCALIDSPFITMVGAKMLYLVKQHFLNCVFCTCIDICLPLLYLLKYAHLLVCLSVHLTYTSIRRTRQSVHPSYLIC